KNQFALDALTNAAFDQDFQNIHHRISTDTDYCEGLASVLAGRISTFRRGAKDAAVAAIFRQYAVQQDCAGLVGRLLAGQSYIYPHHPDKVNPRDHQVEVRGSCAIRHGQAIGSQPYEHPGVAAVIGAAFFKGSNSIAEKIEAMFPRHEGHLEITKPMLALACAGIHDVLNDYSTGEYKDTKFEGSRVQDIYDVHILMLDHIETKNPDRFHDLMASIFTAASRGSSLAKVSKAPPTLLQQEALAKLDI
ncbi:hypothetical protein R3P38DRAFT_3444387, partial [Favolaschia claudopus]